MNLYKKILSEKERLKLLNFVKTKLLNFGPTYPGLQSKTNLHTYKELQPFLKKITPYTNSYHIKNVWVNYTIGDDICWHSHKNIDRSIVYYLQNKSNIGTMFKQKGTKVLVTECPQNSLMIFDSFLEHSGPCHLPEDRYSIALDLIKK